MGADAEIDMFVCEPETDPEFCERLEKNCGTVTDLDNCGEMRQAQCGTCLEPAVCGMDNVCSCDAETNEEFCSRLGADCDDLTAVDNCGRERTVDCGSCDGNEVCGERSPNVCGCPCDINGTCYPENAPNPSNPCEICDPTSSTTDWTVDVGATCSDGDACTVDDVCTATATCEGVARDCSSEDSECADGVCDPANGNCIAQFKPNETPCSTDNVSCTVDQCINGACNHDEIVMGECRINGTCYTLGDSNPSNECQACRPTISQSRFSSKMDGDPCAGDSLGCTVDQCVSGVCDSSMVGSGTCLVSGTCYAMGDPNPSNECESCQPNTDQTSFSAVAENTPCTGDSLSCTEDLCKRGVCDSSTISSTSCLVNGTCYGSGTESPTNECEECVPGTSQTSFSPKTDTTSCAGDGLSCTVDQCISGVCDHTTLQTNTCLINGTCYNQDDANPSNPCEDCNSATPRVWSDKDGDSCDDSLTCTGDGVCSGGACDPGTVTTGCLISSMCVAEGAFEDPNLCNVCDSTTDTTSWTPLAMGQTCTDDGFACTEDVCDGNNNCVHNVTTGCLIDSACHEDGDINPQNPCEVCTPGTSTTSWSPVTAGEKGGCGGGTSCACRANGQCENPGGSSC